MNPVVGYSKVVIGGNDYFVVARNMCHTSLLVRNYMSKVYSTL